MFIFQKGKSPSVKLMSRRENKELAKTNLKNMDKTMQKLRHIGCLADTICTEMLVFGK